MFPVTITIHNAAQLMAVMKSLNVPDHAWDPIPPSLGAVPAKKQTPAPAATTAAAASSPTPAAAPASAPTIAEFDAGNVASAAAATAPTTAAPASEVSFDELKKAFLALSTKAGGRALCEGVLKPHGLAKLSEAKPEQYATLLASIEAAQ